jgi:acetyl-CoA acetyltransferase
MSIDDASTGETTDLLAARRAAELAFAEAGIGPADVDFAEVYAPTTSVEVMVTEALGFFVPGDGARAALAGETSLGGRVAISPSGGLLSRGHPPRVTPLYSVLEAVQQLRHEAGDRQVEGCRVGLTTAEMGRYNGCSVHVFGAAGQG